MSLFLSEITIDIIYEILSFLFINDINNLYRSNKQFKNICKNDNFWYYYINKNYLSHEYGFEQWNTNIFNTLVLKDLNIKSWTQLINLINNGKSVEFQIWFEEPEPDPIKIYLHDTLKSLQSRLKYPFALAFDSNGLRLGTIYIQGGIEIAFKGILPQDININTLISQIILDNGKTLFETITLLNVAYKSLH